MVDNNLICNSNKNKNRNVGVCRDGSAKNHRNRCSVEGKAEGKAEVVT